MKMEDKGNLHFLKVCRKTKVSFMDASFLKFYVHQVTIVSSKRLKSILPPVSLNSNIILVTQG